MAETFKTDFFLQYQNYFDCFRNKHFFITGGTGFFGKWLLTALIFANRTWKTNIRATLLSRNPDKFVLTNPCLRTQQDFDFIQGDIRNFSCTGKKFDYLIHAASLFGPQIESDYPEKVTSIITGGTERILDFVTQSGASKMLYISSGAVYGSQPRELDRLPEDFLCSPVSVYGKGKVVAEKMCLNSGVDTVIARCFAFIGPYLPLDEHFAIGNFINDCLHRRKLVIKGDGRPLRSYLYAGDLALWLLRILGSGRNGSIYNVGSDQAVSIRELAETVARISGETLDIEVLQKPDSSTLPPRYVPSISKAIEQLGLKVFTPLEMAIAESIRFYREIEENRCL